MSRVPKLSIGRKRRKKCGKTYRYLRRCRLGVNVSSHRIYTIHHLLLNFHFCRCHLATLGECVVLPNRKKSVTRWLSTVSRIQLPVLVSHLSEIRDDEAVKDSSSHGG